jgi:hypothetical protein
MLGNLGEQKMDFSDLINQNISKKWGLAIAGMGLLWQVGAPSWQIAGVAAIAIIVQGILDLKGK